MQLRPAVLILLETNFSGTSRDAYWFIPCAHSKRFGCWGFRAGTSRPNSIARLAFDTRNGDIRVVTGAGAQR